MWLHCICRECWKNWSLEAQLTKMQGKDFSWSEWIYEISARKKKEVNDMISTLFPFFIKPANDYWEIPFAWYKVASKTNKIYNREQKRLFHFCHRTAYNLADEIKTNQIYAFLNHGKSIKETSRMMSNRIMFCNKR